MTIKRISASKAKWLLRKRLKSRIFWSRKILLFDSEYDLVYEPGLRLKPVTLGAGDCDDRAWAMMAQVIAQYPRALFGFSEGYDRRGLKHAFCFLMNEVLNVRYIEPSTAEIYDPTNEEIYHFIR